jgi:hypothetical protein
MYIYKRRQRSRVHLRLVYYQRGMKDEMKKTIESQMNAHARLLHAIVVFRRQFVLHATCKVSDSVPGPDDIGNRGSRNEMLCESEGLRRKCLHEARLRMLVFGAAYVILLGSIQLLRISGKLATTTTSFG